MLHVVRDININIAIMGKARCNNFVDTNDDKYNTVILDRCTASFPKTCYLK